MEDGRSRCSSTSYISGSSSDQALPTSDKISSLPKRMKIVIAGNNGFAQYLARQPELQRKGWQVIQTEYQDNKELQYLLTGVDVVISTIAGDAQIALIDAAAAVAVKRFIPSEFGPDPLARLENEPEDNKRCAALARLRFHAVTSGLQFAVFSCGLFYERFAPGGLATSEINVSGSLGGEGALLVNMRTAEMMTSFHDSTTHISLTSARDAAQYVVAALALKHWSQQFCFNAQRLTLLELGAICERVRGHALQLIPYDIPRLQASIAHACSIEDRMMETRYSQTLAIAQGRFDLKTADLDTMVNINYEPFEQWLTRMWTFSG